MKTTIHWAYDGHREAFQEALSQICAVNQDGKLNREYGTALYLLTGLEDAWPQLSQYVTLGGIDHAKMLRRAALSTGEKLIVGLSGNLFNSHTYVKFTPVDLIDYLDSDTWKMVLVAFAIRRGTLTLTLRDIADD